MDLNDGSLMLMFDGLEPLFCRGSTSQGMENVHMKPQDPGAIPKHYPTTATSRSSALAKRHRRLPWRWNVAFQGQICWLMSEGQRDTLLLPCLLCCSPYFQELANVCALEVNNALWASKTFKSSSSKRDTWDSETSPEMRKACWLISACSSVAPRSMQRHVCPWTCDRQG